VDPLLTALGIEVAAGAFVDVGGALLRWAKRDEVGRLLDEIESHLSETPGLSATALAPLREDSEFLRLLAVFFFKGVFPREEFVAVIEPHVGSTAELDPVEVAGQVADTIRDFGARARDKDRELFAVEVLREELRQQHQEQADVLRDIRQEIQGVRQVRHVTVEWAPPLARDALQRLLDTDPEDVAAFEDALSGQSDPRSLIQGLVNDPPGWLQESSFKRWTALGDLASGYALWEASAKAFEHASDLPGANRAALLARAASGYKLSHQDDRHLELLAKAENLAPDELQVALTRAPLISPASERLGYLQAVPPQSEPRKQAALRVAIALAQLEESLWDEAERSLAEVTELDPGNLGARDLRIGLALGRARSLASRGELVDVQALRQAAADSLELRDGMIASFRFGEAGHLLARAAEVCALSGDNKRAVELLGEARPEELANREAALALGLAALAAQDPALAASLLPQDAGTELERLAYAEAAAFSDDAAIAADSVAPLEELLASTDESVRAEAAFARQVAALTGEIDPSDDARQILETESPAMAALLDAERMRRSGQEIDAVRRLLPYQDDIRILRTLVRWAGQAEDWDRVLELARAIHARSPSPEDTLLYADVLRRTGSTNEALGLLAGLRQHPDTPPHIRRDAFATSAQLESDALDFTSLEAVSREWLAFDSEDAAAEWARVFALARLSRPDEAAAGVQELRLEPRSATDAQVLALIIEQTEEPLRAAQAIAVLSDRFGRPEKLEALFLITALRAPDGGSEDFNAAVRERMASFEERFPESQIITSVPIDTTPEGVERFFREHIAPGSERVSQVAEDVGAGKVALAALAAVTGKPVTRVALELERGLPLAFPDSVLRGLELDSALGAVGRAAVWDPVAVAVVAMLPKELGDSLRLALPASAIAQATLDDVARTADDSAAGRDEYSTVGFDPATQRGWIRDHGPEDVARLRADGARALELAQLLNVRPNVDRLRPTSLDELLEQDDREIAFATWPASHALAERDHLPLYSDDRVVRVHARRAGIQSFGTLALVEALVTRGHLESPDAAQVRELLLARGAHGVGSTLDELLAEARRSGWGLTPPLAFALTDPTNWGLNVADTYRLWSGFLRAAFDEAAPETFKAWVLRFMDAAKQGLPQRGYGFVAQSLLMIAWKPFTPERVPFFHALIAELRQARMVFGWYPDPVQVAARGINAMHRSDETTVGRLLTRAFLQDVPFEDQLALLGVELRDG
jgi:hypothetical protein